MAGEPAVICDCWTCEIQREVTRLKQFLRDIKARSINVGGEYALAEVARLADEALRAEVDNGR